MVDRVGLDDDIIRLSAPLYHRYQGENIKWPEKLATLLVTLRELKMDKKRFPIVGKNGVVSVFNEEEYPETTFHDRTIDMFDFPCSDSYRGY